MARWRSQAARRSGESREAPDRYKVIAFQMAVELVNWPTDPKDMTNIERLMDNSGRRLDLSRPGEPEANPGHPRQLAR